MDSEVVAIYFQTWVTAIITFLVGLGAFGVYMWQKRDQKKTAARIILIEIENAESQLKIVKDSPKAEALPENTRLMPTASWEKYRHLFARMFTPREWDTISDFYNKCLEYDRAVTYDASSLELDIEAFRSSVNNALALVLAVTILNDNGNSLSDDELDAQYVELQRKLTTVFMEPKNLFIYKPTKPLNEAARAIRALDSVMSLTSVGDKLRKISKPNLLQRILSKN